MCLQQKKMEMFTGEFLKQEGYVTKVLLSDGNNYANELEVNITLNGYKRYYGSLEFQRDLMRYFNVSRGILAAHIHGLVMSVLGLIRPGEKAVRHPLVRTTSISPSACSSTISRPKAFLCSLAET